MADIFPPAALLVALPHMDQRHGQEVGKEIAPLALGYRDERFELRLKALLFRADRRPFTWGMFAQQT
jgi:hypothetical protein